VAKRCRGDFARLMVGSLARRSEFKHRDGDTGLRPLGLMGLTVAARASYGGLPYLVLSNVDGRD